MRCALILHKFYQVVECNVVSATAIQMTAVRRHHAVYSTWHLPYSPNVIMVVHDEWLN